ncbi:MAG TPA: HAMP domain-containing sensor histidine kinase [Streptosporangiaceae bacterium]
MRAIGSPPEVVPGHRLHWPYRLSSLRWPHRPPGLRWPRGRPAHRWPFAWVDVAWGAFSVANLIAITFFAEWETVPFHFIWISLTLLYGFRVWSIKPTMWVLAVVMVTTFAAISWAVFRGSQSADELNEVPLMAAMFGMMVWHAQRRLTAYRVSARISAENARLLATQRRFLQDASHQLRTPITIALGHAELLASELAGSGRAEERDIGVVVGELVRLRRLSERLLMIAAAEDPDFLRPEPVALDRFTMDVLRKWMPTAQRRWQLGRLDEVMVDADRERLGLAVDALLENAIRHTRDGDVIQLSVLAAEDGSAARMIIADTGTGIPPSERDHIFDRFRSGSELGDGRRTGLGLALVRAVARAHGGDALVHSAPGHGSEFELVLPVTAPAADAAPAAGDEPPGGAPAPGLTAALPSGAGPGGGTVPASAPSPPRPPGPGQTALEDQWRGRTR